MSDTPMTDAVIENVPMRGTYAEYREHQFTNVSDHARRLEKALKVAERELIAIHNAASTQGLPTFAAKVKDTLATIAKLKEDK